MIPRSIRWRLQLWQLILLAAAIALFGCAAYELARRSRQAQFDSQLAARVAALSQSLRRPHGPAMREAGPPDEFAEFPDGGPPPGPRGGGVMQRSVSLTTETTQLFHDAFGRSCYFRAWLRDDAPIRGGNGGPADVPRPLRPGVDTEVKFRTRDGLREAYHFTELGDCLLVGCGLGAESGHLRRYALALTLGGGAVLLLGFALSALMLGRFLRPITAIAETAGRVADGTLSARIPPQDPHSELGRLSESLNATFARLEAAFVRQRQFTADASHELRTPLSVIIAEAQGALRRERTPAEYRETLESCLTAAQRMRQLADSLLELARLDAGDAPPRRDRIDLAEVAQLAISEAEPRAAQAGLTLRSELQPAPTLGDPIRLGRVVANLVDNAIAYNRPAGRVHVTTRMEAGHAVLAVADSGEGIGEPDLPHIFQRFYRADKARSRAEGHFGLGLAICKGFVEEAGGTLAVESRVGGGSTFTVRLPAAAPGA